MDSSEKLKGKSRRWGGGWRSKRELVDRYDEEVEAYQVKL